MFMIWIVLAMGAPLQAGPDPAATTVASFVGEEVIAVGRVDLSQVQAILEKGPLPRPLADIPEVQQTMAVVSQWVDTMRAAGAQELDVLLDASSLPGLPVIVVPIAEGADADRIAQALKSTPPLSWPVTANVRGAVVGGTREAIERLTVAPAANRADYPLARAEAIDAPISVQVIPGTTMRRALEETLPTLPESLGGGPITTLSRGLSWAVLQVEPGPDRFTLTLQVQGADAAVAKSLSGVLTKALTSGRAWLAAQAETKSLASQLEAVQPVVEGSRVRLRADLRQINELLRGPLEASRQAARRSQCMNHLKQIAMAMHHHIDAKRTFPPAYTASKDGKPLLSWRVAILPYLDQKALYDEFHHDEPWDSAHNKALLERMPEVYRCPASGAGAGLTTYLAPRGPGTMFPGAEGVPIRDVIDGTSNTILVLDAGEAQAVPWTKPGDWEVGDKPDSTALASSHPGGFLSAFADGSVRFLAETIHPAVLRALLTRNGGEVVSQDAY
jgi:hypothetical protein